MAGLKKIVLLTIAVLSGKNSYAQSCKLIIAEMFMDSTVTIKQINNNTYQLRRDVLYKNKTPLYTFKRTVLYMYEFVAFEQHNNTFIYMYPLYLGDGVYMETYKSGVLIVIHANEAIKTYKNIAYFPVEKVCDSLGHYR